ncbi:hypothetical protein CHUAL_005089 [Chamberlinius hualienensis]
MDVQEDTSTLNNLIWQLKYADNKRERLKAIESLIVIARSIGHQRTIDELIPFLQVLINQYDDLDCLNLILDQLSQLSSYLKGRDCVDQLLSIYDLLLKTENEQLQSRAVGYLKSFSLEIKTSKFDTHLKPHLHRLSTDNCISTRKLSCLFYYSYYQQLQVKDDLLHDFEKLCVDPIPCIREAAAYQLGGMCKIIDFEHLRSFGIQQLIALAEDKVDYVRIASIDAFLGISGKLIPRNVEQYLMPLIAKLAQDVSHRVRLYLVKRFTEVQRVIGFNICRTHLLPVIAVLYNDSVADVRAAAIRMTIDFCNNLDESSRDHFLCSILFPQLERLSSDPIPQVRVATCQLLSLASYLNLENIQKYMAPAVSLLRDECHSVQFNAAKNIGYIKSAVDTAVISNIINGELLVAVKLNKTEKLLRMIDCLPLYASELGENVLNSSLLENVFTIESSYPNIFVKMSVINAMKKVTESLKLEWAKKVLISYLKTLLSKNAYEVDDQCLRWTQVLLDALPFCIVDDEVLQLLKQLSERSIDKNQLRLSVLQSVNQAKHAIEIGALKEGVKKLDSLFTEETHKELLESAFTVDSEKAVVVDSKKNEIVPVELSRKPELSSIVVSAVDSDFKRFSLPPTPLFEDGSHFKFSKLKPANRLSGDSSTRRRGSGSLLTNPLMSTSLVSIDDVHSGFETDESTQLVLANDENLNEIESSQVTQIAVIEEKYTDTVTEENHTDNVVKDTLVESIQEHSDAVYTTEEHSSNTTDVKLVSDIEDNNIDIVEENKTSSIEKNNVDIVEENNVNIVEENIVDIVEENNVNIIEENTVDIVEENNADIVEENNIDMVEENNDYVIGDQQIHVVEEELVDLVEHKPINIVEENNVDIVEENNVDVIEDQQIHVVEEELVDLVEHKPINIVEEEQVSIIEEKIVSIVEEKLVDFVGDNQDSVAGDNQDNIVEEKHDLLDSSTVTEVKEVFTDNTDAVIVEDCDGELIDFNIETVADGGKNSSLNEELIEIDVNHIAPDLKLDESFEFKEITLENEQKNEDIFMKSIEINERTLIDFSNNDSDQPSDTVNTAQQLQETFSGIQNLLETANIDNNDMEIVESIQTVVDATDVGTNVLITLDDDRQSLDVISDTQLSLKQVNNKNDEQLEVVVGTTSILETFDSAQPEMKVINNDETLSKVDDDKQLTNMISSKTTENGSVKVDSTVADDEDDDSDDDDEDDDEFHDAITPEEPGPANIHASLLDIPSGTQIKINGNVIEFLDDVIDV